MEVGGPMARLLRERWIYLPDKQEWRCEMPARGHIRGVCVCFWVESKDGKIYSNRR